MPKNIESKPGKDDLSATEVYAAIRYLEHQPMEKKEHGGDVAGFLLCAIFLIMLGCIALVLFLP